VLCFICELFLILDEKKKFLELSPLGSASAKFQLPQQKKEQKRKRLSKTWLRKGEA
jgi:hypothetical protein